jgi:Ti type entry exclusion protein TrbK
MVNTKLALILIVIAFAGGVGGGWFIFAGPQPPPQSRSDFFKTPQSYPTSGGQEMRPRW